MICESLDIQKQKLEEIKSLSLVEPPSSSQILLVTFQSFEETIVWYVKKK